MIVITGGAGFIGSNLNASLVARGHETLVVDRLGGDVPGKWRNLRHNPPDRIVAPADLAAFLAGEPPVEMVFHLGAVSSTTALDGDLVWRTNVGLSRMLWDWCAARGRRMVYASSAATYGDGGAGFDDDPALLATLRPLNLYGWSKHAFDRQAARAAAAGSAPAQWVGLKLFNVYGPNEYHKGGMISVVRVKYEQAAAGRRPTLFRSDRPDLPDGAQARDFIWVGDVVDVMLWLLDTPGVSGLFNLGTGLARTYRDLARAVCAAVGTPDEVAWVDMPASLAGQYQSFTQASMERLRAAGYLRPFTTLEDGIARYVNAYLRQPDAYV